MQTGCKPIDSSLVQGSEVSFLPYGTDAGADCKNRCAPRHHRRDRYRNCWLFSADPPVLERVACCIRCVRIRQSVADLDGRGIDCGRKDSPGCTKAGCWSHHHFCSCNHRWCAALFAVAFLIDAGKPEHHFTRHLLLALVTVVLSWLFVRAVFGLPTHKVLRRQRWHHWPACRRP